MGCRKWGLFELNESRIEVDELIRVGVVISTS